MLKQVKPEHFFYCADGSVLRSIQELENKLRTIGSEAYAHHANESKNDFHNWIRDVFQEQELASQILAAKTQAEAAALVRKHLNKAMQANAEIEKAIKSVLSVRRRTIVAAKKAANLATKKSVGIVKKKARKIGKKIQTAKPTVKRHVATAIKSRRTAIPKKRKVNKKSSEQKSNQPGRPKHNKKKVAAHKQVKKQVNKWLNWLKLVPAQS